MRHTKNYGVYYWDTFDNETFLLAEFDSLKEANKYVQKNLATRISGSGADQVDIVDKLGNVIEKFRLGFFKVSL